MRPQEGVERQRKALLAAKGWYALFFGSLAFVFPYLNLYFRQLGHSASEIGVLSALRPWIGASTSGAWCALADNFDCHRAMFGGLYVSSVLVTSSLAFKATPFAWLLAVVVGSEVLRSPIAVLADAAVSSVTTHSSQYGRCRLWGAITWGGVSAFAGALVGSQGMAVGFALYLLSSLAAFGVIVCGLDFTSLSSAQPKLSQARTSRKAPPLSAQNEGSGQSQHRGTKAGSGNAFAGDAERQALLWGGSQCREHRSDDVRSVELPGKVGAEGDQGPQHLERGGMDDSGDEMVVIGSEESVNSAASALHGRDLVSHCQSSDDDADGDAGVGASAAGVEQITPDAGGFPPCVSTSGSLCGTAPAPRVAFKDKLQLFGMPEVIIFLMKFVLMGFGVGVVDGFEFLYLDSLGGGTLLMGLGITFTCVAEVPVFHYSGAIIDALGVQGSLNLVLAAFVVRLGAYSTMSMWPTLWLLLPVELLHGLTFGLAWAVGTLHSAAIAPPGLNATVQSAFQSSYFGVGTGIGGLIGGLLYEHAGAAPCFLWAAAIVLCGWGVCSLLQHRMSSPAERCGRTGDSVQLRQLQL